MACGNSICRGDLDLGDGRNTTCREYVGLPRLWIMCYLIVLAMLLSVLGLGDSVRGLISDFALGIC